MALYGAVELGGTKTLAAIGTAADDMSEIVRIPTAEPESTLGSVIAHFQKFPIDSVGIASFGPVELRPGHESFGTITSTPKPGWAHTPVAGTFSDALGVPVGIDTDVNGAALGEGEWGAAVGLSDFVYITVGTGIGGGAIVNGRPLIAMGHPEMGHVPVRPLPGDDFPGRCPYHGACLEGVASGPALDDRFGPVEKRSDPGRARDLAAHYVAQGLRAIVYTLAPQRIIVGGGVSEIPGFHEHLREELVDQLSGYPSIAEHEWDSFVVPPGLGDRSGLAGALVLARGAH